jgi:hypothetical protein
MEDELAKLRADNPTATIRVEITPTFPAGTSPKHGGAIRRPDRFDVEVKMNGTIFKEFDIPNP